MQIEINAQTRTLQGTGASRRLRRAGRTPGILYGGNEAAVAIELDHNELFQHLRKEAFHSSILALNLDGKKQRVLLRAFNMHPFRKEVQHIDFQRISATEKIHMSVPVHFLNQDKSEAVRTGGAKISHILTEIQVRCLPDDLPEFVEVDLGNIGVNESVHASAIKLPAGVELVVARGEDPVLAMAAVPRAVEEEPEAPAPAAAAPTAGAAPAAGAAATKPAEEKKK